MRALDLFAGTGWGVACKRLGIAEAGVEKMPEARATRAAADMVTIANDVWEIDRDLIDAIFDGLIASPPCQTFSAAGKGAGRKALDDVLGAVEDHSYKSMERLRNLGVTVGDERTALVLTPLHYWHEMRPQWVAFEQVPTVLPVWEACAEVMRDAGYSVWTGNLQAEMFGVPQTRKRAFLLASLDREAAPPVPTHSRYYPRSPAKLDEGVDKWVSMAEALLLNDLMDPGADDGIPVAMRSNYGTGGNPSLRGERTLDQPAPTVTSKIDRNKWVLRNNNTANAAERELDQPAPTLYFGQRSNYVAWERKEPLPDWAYRRPSTTIVGTFKPEIVAAPGYRTTVSRQNAPDSVRVTVQEAGVLQSYPANFPWQGSKSKQYLQVGNAVPPLLAEHVLSAVTGIKREV